MKNRRRILIAATHHKRIFVRGMYWGGVVLTALSITVLIVSVLLIALVKIGKEESDNGFSIALIVMASLSWAMVVIVIFLQFYVIYRKKPTPSLARGEKLDPFWEHEPN